MAEINTIFAVPMVFHKMEDCTGLNAELEALFVERAAEGKKYSNPSPFVDRNETLFESNFRLFDWPHDCVRRLRDFCIPALYGAIGELNGYGVEQLKRLHMATESWYHLTRRGGFFGVLAGCAQVPGQAPAASWPKEAAPAVGPSLGTAGPAAPCPGGSAARAPAPCAPGRAS